MFFVRFKLLAATLALAGFGWSLPMRNSAFIHDFEALFYIGIPLVFFTLALLCVHRLASAHGAMMGLAALVLVLSSFQMSRVGHNATAVALQDSLIQDFEVIRALTRGQRVSVPYLTRNIAQLAGARHAVNFYLADRFIQYQSPDLADFVLLARAWAESRPLLTTENRVMFLVEPFSYRDIVAEVGAPAIVNRFDVYFDAHRRWLLYVQKRGCQPETEHPFFLHLVPMNDQDLPNHRWPYDFDNLDFKFEDHALLTTDGTWIALLPLPTYGIPADQHRPVCIR